jgi:hypothetical protein
MAQQGDGDKGQSFDAADEMALFHERLAEKMALGTSQPDAVRAIAVEDNKALVALKMQDELKAQNPTERQPTGPAQENTSPERSQVPAQQGVDMESKYASQGRGIADAQHQPTLDPRQELAEFEGRAVAPDRKKTLEAGPEIDGTRSARNDLKTEHALALAALADYEKGVPDQAADSTSDLGRQPPDPNDIQI